MSSQPGMELAEIATAVQNDSNSNNKSHSNNRSQ